MAKARKTAPGQVGELASCHRVLDSLGLRDALRPYRPRIVGSMPLGLRTADSDIDVLVEVSDLDAFATKMHEAHGATDDFLMYRRAADDHGPEALVVRIETAAYPVEIHAQGRPTVEQIPYRHYAVLNRLLRLGGGDLREEVLARKEDGERTEQAFAGALGLEGDASTALLALEHEPDSTLCDLLEGKEAA
ncbi:DUF4269 domain-containing protein [Caenispirillum salinarum]|uniref:DUF4269 domain-containing protein n=1 Tax=Caenispirillum salinarum TaxID=859058 RepID=UPI0038513504